MNGFLLLMLAACWSPKAWETGPTSMVGRLLDVEGQPLAGVDIETVESRWKTEPDGGFAVNYKEPAQMLTFRQGVMQYTRRYRPEDDGKVVTVQVPITVPRMLRCEMDSPCDGELEWDLGDGLAVRTSFNCDRDEPIRFDAAPVPMPVSGACRQDGKELPVQITEVDGDLVMTPPPVPVTVMLSLPGSDTDHTCTVSVAGKPATRGADGLWTGSGFGMVQLDATCDGVPAVPARWYVRTPSQLPLIWRPSDLTLKLSDHLPWAKDVLLFAAGENGGWTMTLAPGADGTLRLPALGAGTFVFAANMRADRLVGTQAAEGTALSPDVLHLRDLPREGRVTDVPEAIGLLVRTANAPAGPIPVTFYPAEE